METVPEVHESTLLQKIAEQNSTIIKFHAAEDQKLNMEIQELMKIRAYLRELVAVGVVVIILGILALFF